MLIKNLTSKKQKLEVRELTGERREYEIFIEPAGSTELENLIIINPERYAGIFDTGDCIHMEKSPVINEVDPVEEEKSDDDSVEKSDTTPEESVEEPQESEESSTAEEVSDCICDICGAEFASARGLSSHKNRVHAE